MDGTGGETIVATQTEFDADATTLFFGVWFGNEGTISRREKAGGAITKVTSAGSVVFAVAVDDVDVYWLDQNDSRSRGATRLMSAPKIGGSPRLVPSGSVFLSATLALDETCVYWGGAHGIMRAPKK